MYNVHVHVHVYMNSLYSIIAYIVRAAVHESAMNLKATVNEFQILDTNE